MIIIRGLVKFTGVVKAKANRFWEGIETKWTMADKTWDKWL